MYFSESVDQDEEEAAANAAPLFTCQKSTTSGTSSDLTGTDSHCEHDFYIQYTATGC